MRKFNEKEKSILLSLFLLNDFGETINYKEKSLGNFIDTQNQNILMKPYNTKMFFPEGYLVTKSDKTEMMRSVQKLESLNLLVTKKGKSRTVGISISSKGIKAICKLIGEA